MLSMLLKHTHSRTIRSAKGLLWWVFRDFILKTFFFYSDLTSSLSKEPPAKKFHFECNTCGKTFSRNDNFKRHQLTRNREKSFACDICGKKFSLKQHLSRYKKIHERRAGPSVEHVAKNSESRHALTNILSRYILTLTRNANAPIMMTEVASQFCFLSIVFWYLLLCL